MRFQRSRLSFMEMLSAHGCSPRWRGEATLGSRVSPKRVAAAASTRLRSMHSMGCPIIAVKCVMKQRLTLAVMGNGEELSAAGV